MIASAMTSVLSVIARKYSDNDTTTVPPTPNVPALNWYAFVLNLPEVLADEKDASSF